MYGVELPPAMLRSARRFRIPEGWISAILIFIFEYFAGREHFTNGRDFIRRGGIHRLVRRLSLDVEKMTVASGGNIALYLLRLQHSNG
jgi:hypothetical protein